MNDRPTEQGAGPHGFVKVWVKIRRAPHAADLPLPTYATAQAAGMDVRAAVPADEPLTLLPGQRALVPTGLHMALPPGFEAQVRPRSGLALKHGITCLNSPGTIDADYRGEIGVILVNFGAREFIVERGMRIAQLVVAPVARVAWQEVEEMNATPRAESGFGSTGR